MGDRAVRRVGFGTKRLAARTGSAGRDDAIRLLRRAVELGVNHVDTAGFYPSWAEEATPGLDFTNLGWANDAVRQALAPYPDDLVIVTKVGPTEQGMARPDQLPGLVEADLRALGRETLDVVYLRQQTLKSVADHFGVLAELQAKGMIRRLALSNIREHHLDEAQAIAPVVAVSNRYGVGFGRVNDALLRRCAEESIAFVPFFSLTGPRRETGGVADSGPVEAIAREYGATAAQIRIAWTLSQGDHVLAIPGTSNPEHLEQNLAAGSVQLAAEHLAVLNAVDEEN